jgi:putative N6-adenine-specific DNA methylase
MHRPPARSNPRERPKAPPKSMADGPCSFYAAVPPGLEPVVVRELALHGVEGQIEPGGVRFQGPLRLARLAGELWTPSRLQVELISGHARSLEELAALTRKAEWKAFLPPGARVEVEASCSGSRLHFREAIERKVGFAVQDAAGRPRERDALVQPVRVRLVDDLATLSVDAGGELLHRRGWRLQPGRAPIRETIASALLFMAGWQADEVLLDPLCGSGTIPIEAARRAAGMRPGEGRSYAFEAWPALRGLSLTGLKPGGARPAPASATIYGSDRDPGAIAAAQDNAARARVKPRWSRIDLAELEAPAPSGLVLTNPPWGERVGDEARALDVLGQALRGPLSGWRALFLVPDASLALRVDRRARCLTTFQSGGLRIGAFVVEG